MFCHLI